MHSLLLVISVIFQQLPPAGADAAPSEGEDSTLVVASLNAAYEQWLAGVEFRGDYILEKGMTTKESAAFEGVIEHPQQWSDGMVFSCRGLIVKTQGEYRVSGDYGGPPIAKNNGRTTRMAFDEVRTREVRATHYPNGVRNTDNSTRRGSIIAEAHPGGELNLADRYAAGPASRSQISPLAILGGEVRLPCVLNAKAGIPIDTRVKRLDPERLEITLETTGDSSRRRVVVWRTETSPPVVESIHETFDWPSKGVKTVHAGYASNFVECRGGSVPGRVVEIVWDLAHPEQWSVRKWESKNLSSDFGQDDLAITVGPGTQVGGLQEPPRTSEGAKIDIANLTTADIRAPRTPLPREPVVLKTKGGPSFRFWIVNLLVVTLLLGTIALRRWRKS